MMDRGLDAFDSVYFLMWPGWKAELRSNRWHYARRWARLKPVVLVQADRLLGGSGSKPEPRFGNATILSIAATTPDQGLFAAARLRTEQIHRHMRRAGHARPLLWIYNPFLLAPAAALAAAGRVLHATENYFDFDPARVPTGLLPLLRTTARICDAVVAVSPGVAEGVLREVPGARVTVVTNGCDYAEYSAGRPSVRLRRAAAGFERVAIYAGNINYRLDLALMRRCAERYPRTLFAVFGPVAGLPEEQRREWVGLLTAKNVRHFGPAATSELPDLYAAADVGMIPYRRIPMVERNGFPLKALEMVATGLPVVSTYMKPLEAVADALSLERDSDTFVSRVGERSRGALTEAEARGMRDVARANDYDRKFEEMLVHVLPSCHPPTSALDEVVAEGWGKEWDRAMCERRSSLSVALVHARGLLLPRLLGPIGRALPDGVVRALRRTRGGRRVLSATGRHVG